MSDAFFGESLRTSRKARRCDYCWQGIAVSERYMNVRLVHCGDFQNQHLHPECRDDIMQQVGELGSDFEWVPGENPRPSVRIVEE